jgi:hypothetical protein
MYSVLKKYVVCGYKDISGEPYAGMSGRHDREGKAVSTTNGAGPHNIQMFLLSSDGHVLTCLPGYWAPQDLLTEVRFAAQLDQVWKNPSLSEVQKDAQFKQMHLAHVAQHSKGMIARSHLQGFDANHEMQKPGSDFLKGKPSATVAAAWGPDAKPNWGAGGLKTTDEVMHERMTAYPFVSYDRFNVASYSDYGLWKYDKHEDARMADGSIDHDRAHALPTIGDPPSQQHNKKAANAQQSNLWGNNEWGSK